MTVKTVAVTYGRKQNLGNYNTAHVEVSLWADIDESEAPEVATLQLQAQARELVKAEVMRLVARPTAQVTVNGSN